MQKLIVSRLWKLGALATVGTVFQFGGCPIFDLIASLLGGLGGFDITSLLGGVLGGAV
ncbi:MAG: hypothetical protein V3W34_17555 [Phycisphaerae bacterium]